MFICISCSDEKIFDSNTFKFQDSIMYYQGVPFTGRMIRFNGRIKKNIPYRFGKVHGEEQHFYEDGSLYKQRFYKDGLAIGKHRIFYPDGSLKKEMFFVNDMLDGDYTEFYPDGKVYIYKLYEKGMALGHKQWRKNGQIFANVVYKDGKRYGLYGGKLCNDIEDL